MIWNEKGRGLANKEKPLQWQFNKTSSDEENEYLAFAKKANLNYWGI